MRMATFQKRKNIIHVVQAVYPPVKPHKVVYEPQCCVIVIGQRLAWQLGGSERLLLIASVLWL